MKPNGPGCSPRSATSCTRGRRPPTASSPCRWSPWRCGRYAFSRCFRRSPRPGGTGRAWRCRTPGRPAVEVRDNASKESTMVTIGVHEFITLDGVIETPSWTAGYPFDPRMGEAIAGITDPGGAILLGRTTYEMFAPAWSVRTAEEDPGAPFFNNTHKYVVSSTLKSAD